VFKPIVSFGFQELELREIYVLYPVGWGFSFVLLLCGVSRLVYMLRLGARTEDTTTFWCAYISLVGGYRRCPAAISPNLSNLQPTVYQIIVVIGQTHEAPVGIDAQRFCPTAYPLLPPRLL